MLNDAKEELWRKLGTVLQIGKRGMIYSLRPVSILGRQGRARGDGLGDRAARQG